MNKAFFIFIFLTILSVHGEKVSVVKKSIVYILKVRGQSRSTQSHGLVTPGKYLPIAFIVKDGSYVNKGDVVARFSSKEAEFDYQSLLFKKNVVEQNLKAAITTIDNDRLAKGDSLDAKTDKLAFKQASYKRLLSFPLEDEVLKAAGRLKISQLNEEAAAKDLKKSRNRFERKFISKTELDEKQQFYREKKVAMEYAQADLAYIKLPATKSSIRKSLLEIETLEMEVAKLKNEIVESESLGELKKVTARGQKDLIEQQIQEKKENLDKTIVRAPVRGYVKYGDTSRKIAPGARFWRNFRFASIPDFSTLVFDIYLPEGSRKFFKEGDRAKVLMTGRKGEVLEGEIIQIAGVPMDIEEKVKQRWGTKVKLSGIKVYHAVVKPLEVSSWLRPGMNADIELFSSQRYEFPAVPVKYLQQIAGKYYLSVDGLLKEVHGIINQGWFLIESERFRASKVSMDGEFKKVEKENIAINDVKQNLVISGEVVPEKSRIIVVPHIWKSPKIIWLEKEEKEVRKGDLLLRLDGVSTDQEIDEEEQGLLVLTNEVASTEKNLELLERENEFNIKKERNLQEIRGIERDIKLQGLDYRATLRAQLNYLNAKISYERAFGTYNRMMQKKVDYVSKAEVSKAKRDLQRRKLQLEMTEINFAEKKKGATDVERSLASLEFFKQKVRYENFLYSASFKKAKKESELQNVKLQAERQNIKVKQRKRLKKNLEIKSPVDGLLRYEKVWDSDGIRKIQLGTSVSGKMKVMSIPNLDSMRVTARLSERYFGEVSVGMKVKVKIPSIDDKTFTGTVRSIDNLFEPLSRKNSQVGLYSSQEPLGETVFTVNIGLDLAGGQVKPGVIADVYFPFER
ncbi:MAG: efflux RND transporter periplasmic adaptor subunit [Lentisphaeraceae bacterium]|nr:efflux RND transporter periplasmic adaptor subunit [Lentisphaeraceae bacterium]